LLLLRLLKPDPSSRIPNQLLKRCVCENRSLRKIRRCRNE